jgi:hypothetical protein
VTVAWKEQNLPSTVRIATTAACALVLYARMPDAFSHPQFWAEDGTVFFLGAHSRGPSALFDAYAGYLHLIPRATAWFAELLPYEIIPELYFGVSVALTLVTCWLALSPRLDLPFKPLLALAVVAVPHDGEVWGTLTNVQWVASLGMLLLALMHRARKWLPVEALYLLAIGLSGPFSILALPVYVLVYQVRTNPDNAILTGVTATCALIQGAYVVSHPTSVAPVPYDPALWWEVPLTRTWGSLIGGSGPVFHAADSFVLFVIAVATVLWFVVCERTNRLERAALALFLAATLFGPLWRTRAALGGLLPIADNNGDRYFYIPKVLLLWLMILVIDKLKVRGFAALGLALAAITTLRDPSREPRRVKPWDAYAAELRHGEAVDIPINPESWVVRVPARPALSPR